jgi:hypothetical protein
MKGIVILLATLALLFIVEHFLPGTSSFALPIFFGLLYLVYQAAK